jgi:hypothetical protein
MKKLTNEDKIDNLMTSVTLEEAESMLCRADLVVKLRRKVEKQPQTALDLKEPGK